MCSVCVCVCVWCVFVCVWCVCVCVWCGVVVCVVWCGVVWCGGGVCVCVCVCVCEQQLVPQLEESKFLLYKIQHLRLSPSGPAYIFIFSGLIPRP